MTANENDKVDWENFNKRWKMLDLSNLVDAVSPGIFSTASTTGPVHCESWTNRKATKICWEKEWKKTDMNKSCQFNLIYNFDLYVFIFTVVYSKPTMFLVASWQPQSSISTFHASPGLNIDVCSPVTCKMDQNGRPAQCRPYMDLERFHTANHSGAGGQSSWCTGGQPLARNFIQFLTWERFFEDMDDVVTAGSDSVGNWFQEWFIRPETLDILDRWGQFEAYPSLVAAASSETKAVQTCWISTTVRHLKTSSTLTWVMLPDAYFFSD